MRPTLAVTAVLASTAASGLAACSPASSPAVLSDDAPRGDGPPHTAASCLSVDGGGARLLSQLGLYADIATRTLERAVTTYQPAFELWSDGAGKRRFLVLPRGPAVLAKIDPGLLVKSDPPMAMRRVGDPDRRCAKEAPVLGLPPLVPT